MEEEIERIEKRRKKLWMKNLISRNILTMNLDIRAKQKYYILLSNKPVSREKV